MQLLWSWENIEAGSFCQGHSTFVAPRLDSANNECGTFIHCTNTESTEMAGRIQSLTKVHGTHLRHYIMNNPQESNNLNLLILLPVSFCTLGGIRSR
jgi:hypothetical protein